MMSIGWRLLFVVLTSTALCAVAGDPASVWNAIVQTSFEGGKGGTVEKATIVRDRIRITLLQGSVQFGGPLEGLSFAASFRGSGRLQIVPPNAAEAQQLKLFTEQETLDMEFSEAAFTFGDSLGEELGAQLRVGAADASLGDLYRERQRERENVGAEVVPRLFKSLLSQDRKQIAFFAADLKTSRKGWVHVRFDATDPEEILVGRWTNWGTVTLLDTWMHFPAGDRPPAETYRDPLAREDFLIRGYRIEAGIAGSTELRATARVDVEYRIPGERVLLFLLDANLRVDSVKGAGGSGLSFFQPRDPKDRNQSYGDYLAVVLDQPTAAGGRRALEFHYAGKRIIQQVGSGNYFCQSFGWYPTRPNSFATRADFEIHFRSPKRYVLVATGNKVDQTVDGNTIYTTWKSDVPLAVAGFAFGDYKVHKEKAGTIDIEIYANKEADDFLRGPMQMMESLGGRAELPVGTLSPAALVQVMGTEVANTVRLFENYFGPYPYKRLAVTNIPYSYGQGWPGLLYLSALSFLDSTQRNALGIKDHTQISDFFRAHESSHQWWGHRVGWKSYHDQWLSEGFAQFSGNLYVRFRQNEKEFISRVRQDRERLQGRDTRNRAYESLGPIWMGHRLSSSDAPRGYSAVVYAKGGWVLHMLRTMMLDPNAKDPDERFKAMMQDFCRTFENKPASTEDFKAVLEKYMTQGMNLEGNRSMDWFFRQYVYGTGMARYDFRYSVEPAGEGKWKVSAKIAQSEAPAGWKDVLPVYVHTSGRARRLGTYPMVKPEGSFEFVLPFKPDKISLNENEDTLARIHQ